jgi:hypothetical protein
MAVRILLLLSHDAKEVGRSPWRSRRRVIMVIGTVKDATSRIQELEKRLLKEGLSSKEREEVERDLAQARKTLEQLRLDERQAEESYGLDGF